MTTEHKEVKNEIADLDKKLILLCQGPQNRKVLEEIIKYEKRVNDLRIIQTKLKSLELKQAKTAQIEELKKQNEEYSGSILEAKKEVDALAVECEKGPLLNELVEKFGLRSLNKAQGLFNKIDNLSARVQHNLSEIQRLNLEVDNLS